MASRVWHRKPNMPRLRPLGSHWSTTGLVGFWLFHEGAGGVVHDLTGYGNHGTLTNMDPATDWVVGEHGPALDFDGSDDYARVADDPSLDVSAVTIGGIVKCGTMVSDGYIVSKRDGGTCAWGLWIESGAGRANLIGGQTTSNLYSASNVGTSLRHVAATLTAGGSATIYIDGVEDATGDITPCDSESVDVYIGARGDGAGGAIRVLDGRLELAYVYARALSAAEVRALYEQPLLPLQPRTLGLWRYGEAAANIMPVMDYYYRRRRTA